MKLGLIGASGFIGTRLIDFLQTGDYLVDNYDKNVSAKYAGLTTIVNITGQQEIASKLKPCDYVILLAAEHKDDVTPTSLYYDVNIDGTRNVLNAMDKAGIKKIIFTSSVAVYGLNKVNPDENSPVEPFNHYGKTKYAAEEVLRKWYNKDPENRTLIIIRPTVVFGPNNRGNVYNLLAQIAHGKFLMIGKGNNKKSMAYVDNIVGFIKYCLDNSYTGYHLYNYADKPDLTTNALLKAVEQSLHKKLPPVRIPYFIGYTGGLALDVLGKLTGKKFSISSVRVKKFCATTEFSAVRMQQTGYKPMVSLSQGIDDTIKSIVALNEIH